MKFENWNWNLTSEHLSSRTSLYIIKNYITNDNMLLRKIWKISVNYKNSY